MGQHELLAVRGTGTDRGSAVSEVPPDALGQKW